VSQNPYDYHLFYRHLGNKRYINITQITHLDGFRENVNEGQVQSLATEKIGHSVSR
jgi:hypothetical protein